MPQFVRIVNTDDRPFDYHYRNQKHVVSPRADTVVPWDCACSLFGDPAIVDTPRNKDRTRVYKQVRGLYNYEDGTERVEDWEARRPHIEVYDLDTNERIYMVIDDPKGLMSNPDLGAKSSTDVEFLTRQIQQLTSLVMSMQAQDQARQRIAGQTIVPSDDAPGDTEDAFTIQFPDQSDQGATADSPQAPPVAEDAPKLAPRPRK